MKLRPSSLYMLWTPEPVYFTHVLQIVNSSSLIYCTTAGVHNQTMVKLY